MISAWISWFRISVLICGPCTLNEQVYPSGPSWCHVKQVIIFTAVFFQGIHPEDLYRLLLLRLHRGSLGLIFVLNKSQEHLCLPSLVYAPHSLQASHSSEGWFPLPRGQIPWFPSSSGWWWHSSRWTRTACRVGETWAWNKPWRYSTTPSNSSLRCLARTR